MSKFRKKPVVIEAFQMTKDRRWDNSEWPNWLNEAWNKQPSEAGCLYCIDDSGLVGPGERLCITTLEGTHAVSFGDWIIRGVKGEIYPCKPDIFEATYEPYGTNPLSEGGRPPVSPPRGKHPNYAFTLIELLVVIAIIGVLVALTGCEPVHSVPRIAQGPGGYLDDTEDMNRNLHQTGVRDRQIPLEVRQRYAKSHGLQEPGE